MKVTLYHVAAEAGVSIATVSRALNGLPVSARSEALVRAAAARLGYVANQAARSLRSDRTMTMGLIFSDLNNTRGIDLVDAIGAAIEAGGYSLLIASARGDPRRYDLLMRRFLERRVDGLFCVDAHGEGESLAGYAAAGAPVVALFRAAPAFASLPLITPSFADSSAALAAHLASLGHRRVGLIAGEARTLPLAAAGEALKAAGLAPVRVAATAAGGMSEALKAAMTLTPRPTALIAHEPHARGLLAAAAAQRIVIPADLSLLAIGEIGSERRQKRIGLSALIVDPSRMGRAASAAMLAWLAGSKPAERTEVQAGVFEARATSGPAPAVVRLAG